jgi:hypothetical protein
VIDVNDEHPSKQQFLRDVPESEIVIGVRNE